MAKLYPIFLNLKNKPCLVAGGGNVAHRKVKSLLQAGAKVTVVSPELSPLFKSIRNQPHFRWKKKLFALADVQGQWLAVAATNNKAVNAKVAQACAARRVPVNVVDRPDLCDFHVPAVFRQGPLAVAISTGGASPALAKKIRQFLEKGLGKNMGRAVRELEQGRAGLLGLSAREKKKRLDKVIKRAGISL